MVVLEVQKENLTLEMNDEVMVRQEKLGKYFEHHNINSRFGLSFKQFVTKVDQGSWEKFIKDRQPQLPGQSVRG